MKTLILLSASALFVSSLALGSTSIKCDLKVRIGEDGADRPIMKVLASDTKDLLADQNIELKGIEENGESSFVVKIYNDQVSVNISDIKNTRSSSFIISGVDLKAPRLKIIGFLNSDGPETAPPRRVLNCFGN